MAEKTRMEATPETTEVVETEVAAMIEPDKVLNPPPPVAHPEVETEKESPPPVAQQEVETEKEEEKKLPPPVSQQEVETEKEEEVVEVEEGVSFVEVAAGTAAREKGEPSMAQSVSFKEESNRIKDLSEREKRALDELKELIVAALAKHEFSKPPPPPSPPRVKKEDMKDVPAEEVESEKVEEGKGTIEEESKKEAVEEEIGQKEELKKDGGGESKKEKEEPKKEDMPRKEDEVAVVKQEDEELKEEVAIVKDEEEEPKKEEEPVKKEIEPKEEKEPEEKEEEEPRKEEEPKKEEEPVKKEIEPKEEKEPEEKEEEEPRKEEDPLKKEEEQPKEEKLVMKEEEEPVKEEDSVKTEEEEPKVVEKPVNKEEEEEESKAGDEPVRKEEELKAEDEVVRKEEVEPKEKEETTKPEVDNVEKRAVSMPLAAALAKEKEEEEDSAKTVEAIEETIFQVPVTDAGAISDEVVAETKAEEDKTPPPPPEEVFIWGIPLISDEQSDTLLLKFLRARDFKVKDTFTMIKNTVTWRKEFGIEELLNEDLGLSELERVVFTHGLDKERHPVCYNVYGAFQDKDLYQKAFGDEEKRRNFLRWRVQVLEKDIKEKLDFSPGSICTLVQVTDLKNSPGPGKKELRQATKQALALLQDNYPELVAKQIFINVSWWYLVFNRMIAPLFTARTKSKFVFAGPSRSAETLFKYIAPEQVPAQYGGLSAENDTEFCTSDVVTDISIKPSTKHTIQIPVTEKCTLVWEVRVLGWDVSYGAEFVPDAESAYTVIIQKTRKFIALDEPVMKNNFKIGEPGKVVIYVDNATSKKKRLFYRYKTKTSTD